MEIMTLEDLIDVCQSLKPVRPSTLREWHKAAKPLRHLQIADINKAEVMKYRITQLAPRGPLKQNTLKARMASLRGLWNTAIEWELIDGENPWQKADKGLRYIRRKPEFYPWEHYRQYHNDPYFVFLWYTGARIGEIAGLDPKNIVMNAPVPYFNFVHQKNRMLKNDESIRKTPIHPACYPLVPHFKQSKAKRPGASWSETFKKNMQLPHGDAAHTMRHSFYTRCEIANITERIQDILTGHAPRTETARYGKVDLPTLLRELQKLR